MSSDGKEGLGVAPTLPTPEARGRTEELPAGTRVGSWVVESLRSRGGFAVVYRARHASSGRAGALKVLHEHLADSPLLIRRFEKEGETLKRLAHPHIVQIHDFGLLPDQRPYLVMEWLEGRTLEEEIRSRGPLSVAETLAILEDLGAALAAAHDAGVVHRDLKASNVIIVPAGDWFVVKLVDFGIAKILAEEANAQGGQGLTSTGSRLGTPHNMAPEQVLGQPVDARTDIYALGILAFQLLTGRLPFDAPTAIEIEEMHLYAPPPRASELAPVPAAIDGVLSRCLEKRREARYPTVREAMAALRAAAIRRDEAPAWAADVRPSRRFLARQVRAVGLHVVVGLRRPPEEASDEALDALECALARAREAMDDAGFDLAAEGAHDFLAVALSSSEELSSELREHVLDEALALARTLLEDPRLSATLTVHAASVVFAPDGSRRRYLAGDLLCLGQWAAVQREDGVFATDEALAGVEARYQTDVSGIAAGSRRVLRRR